MVVDAIQTAKGLLLRGWARCDAVAEAANEHGLTDEEQTEVLEHLKKYGAI